MDSAETTLQSRSANTQLAQGQATPGLSKGEVTWLSNSPSLEPLEVVAKNRRGEIHQFLFFFSLGLDFVVSSLYFSLGTLKPLLQMGWVVGVKVLGFHQAANELCRLGWTQSPCSGPLP